MVMGQHCSHVSSLSPYGTIGTTLPITITWHWVKLIYAWISYLYQEWQQLLISYKSKTANQHNMIASQNCKLQRYLIHLTFSRPTQPWSTQGTHTLTLLSSITFSVAERYGCLGDSRKPLMSTTKRRKCVRSTWRRKLWPIPTLAQAPSMSPGRSAMVSRRMSLYSTTPRVGCSVVTGGGNKVDY